MVKAFAGSVDPTPRQSHKVCSLHKEGQSVDLSCGMHTTDHVSQYFPRVGSTGTWLVADSKKYMACYVMQWRSFTNRLNEARIFAGLLDAGRNTEPLVMLQQVSVLLPKACPDLHCVHFWLSFLLGGTSSTPLTTERPYPQPGELKRESKYGQKETSLHRLAGLETGMCPLGPVDKLRLGLRLRL
jgi:hypothetical protein